MDTRQVVARFEAERQALAIMDHPNIAKVFDGGSTRQGDKERGRQGDQESGRHGDQALPPVSPSPCLPVSLSGLPVSLSDPGRPYFVMELVKGVPITEFCDENHLTPRQRLELFIPVCQAVQHAHQKGIIHRDLKPSNVLVSRHDSTPVPKVIDFGVAKALGQELTDKTLFTGIAQMIGTPLYMSPEQAGMSDLDIDTRSDIYSLGVLLYELLTGTTPFDKERFKQAAYDEIRRIIRDEDPPKPSTRLSELSRPHAPREESVTRSVTSTLASISAQRQTEPAKLTKLVRGELDWIVMKALEKDRNRRYETANGFVMDVQRYLADEPVQACPPSVGYRLRKFVRRNKGAVAALGAVLVTLMAGTIGTTIGFVNAVRAEQSAVKAYKNADEERTKAESERRKAEDARKVAEQRFTLAKNAVDEYLNRVTAAPKLKQADFFQLRKELLEAAIPFYQKLADEKPDDAQGEEARADAYGRLGAIRSEMGEETLARADYQRMLATYEELVAASPANADFLRGLAVAQNNTANRLKALGDKRAAKELYENAVATWTTLARDFSADAKSRQDHRLQLCKSEGNLAELLASLGDLPKALKIMENVLASRKALVDEAPENAKFRADLAGSYVTLGSYLRIVHQHERGLAAVSEGAAIYEKLVADFPKVPVYREDLSTALSNRGRFECLLNRKDAARTSYQKVIEIREQLVKRFPTVPRYAARLATGFNNMGLVYFEMGKFAEARDSYLRAVDIQAPLTQGPQALPDFRVDLGLYTGNLGRALRELRETPAARKALEQAIAMLAALADEFPLMLDYRFELAGFQYFTSEFLFDQGEHRAAVAMIERARDNYQAISRKAPANLEYLHGLAASWSALGQAFAGLRDPEAALKAFDQCLLVYERLMTTPNVRAGLVHDAAQICAMASSLVKNGAERKDSYAALAMKLLRQSKDRGYFNDPANITRLRQDPVLQSLRVRPEFQKFLNELGKKE